MRSQAMERKNDTLDVFSSFSPLLPAPPYTRANAGGSVCVGDVTKAAPAGVAKRFTAMRVLMRRRASDAGGREEEVEAGEGEEGEDVESELVLVVVGVGVEKNPVRKTLKMKRGLSCPPPTPPLTALLLHTAAAPSLWRQMMRRRSMAGRRSCAEEEEEGVVPVAVPLSPRSHVEKMRRRRGRRGGRIGKGWIGDAGEGARELALVRREERKSRSCGD